MSGLDINTAMMIENGTVISIETTAETPTMIPIAVRIPIITLISLTIVFSNVINITILRTISEIPAMAKICLTNLSCADLLLGLFGCMPSIGTAIIGQWPYGTVWCQISAYVHVISGTVSVWSLVLVSVDRYKAITRSLHYPQLMTRRRCTIMVMLTWFFASIYAIIPLFLRIPEFIYYQFTPGEVLCDFIFEIRWWSICLVIGIAGPVAIILIGTTTSIIRTTNMLSRGIVPKSSGVQQMDANLTRDHVRQTQEMQGNVHRDRKHVNSNKAVRILILTAVTFFIAWGPYVVKTILYSVTYNIHLPVCLEFTRIWIANSSSFMNIFIYSFMYTSFRKREKLLLTFLVRCQIGKIKRFEQ